MTCIKKIKSEEISGSTFRGREISLVGDITDYSFIAKVKSSIQGKITEIVGIKNASKVFFSFESIKDLRNGKYIIEYWGDFAELGEEVFLVEELSIVSPENASGNCSNESQVFEVKINNVTIPISLDFSVVNIYNNGGNSSWGNIGGDIETQTDLIQKFGNYYTKTEVYNKNEVNSELNNKQDKLNADVLGQVLDTELSIKMTPSADDEIVILDSITGDAATVKFSSFGGNVDLSNYYTKTETYSKVEVDNLLDDKQDVIAYTPENYANKSDSYTASSSTTYASTKALVDGLATKLDKGGYTGNAQDLKNEIDTKQKKLSSFDESILIESDGNIEGNVSLFTEYFNQQVCELNFNPIQIVGVYQDGIRLSNSEYEIILPKKIKIKGYVDENIEIQYTHLKS